MLNVLDVADPVVSAQLCCLRHKSSHRAHASSERGCSNTFLLTESDSRLESASGCGLPIPAESTWFRRNERFYCHLLAKRNQEPRNLHGWCVTSSQNPAQHCREPDLGIRREWHSRETGPRLSGACLPQRNTFRTALVLNTEPGRKVDGGLWLSSLKFMLFYYMITNSSALHENSVWAHAIFLSDAWTLTRWGENICFALFTIPLTIKRKTRGFLTVKFCTCYWGHNVKTKIK